MGKATRQAALAHLRLLQQYEAEDARGLVYLREGEADSPPMAMADRLAVADIISRRYGVDHREEIAEHGLDLAYWLGQTELNMYDDLARYIGSENAVLLDRLALGFIPHLANNAFAEATPEAADEYVIGVNLGLYWVSSLLAEALLRTAEGDEDGGLATYQGAIQIYLAQNQRQMHAAWNWRPHLDKLDFTVQGGALGSVVLRFVALHELGHITLGHVGRWRMAYLPERGRVQYGGAEALGLAATHAMELEADAYALDRFLEHTAGREIMWNNLLYIGSFFRLLAHLERQGRIAASRHHPPPLLRLQRLHERTAAAMGPPPNDAWEWAKLVHEEWETNT